MIREHCNLRIEHDLVRRPSSAQLQLVHGLNMNQSRYGTNSCFIGIILHLFAYLDGPKTLFLLFPVVVNVVTWVQGPPSVKFQHLIF